MNDRPRVLVVDDEPQILRALRIILRDAGFEVLQATTAEEALHQAALKPPAAAIVDLVLPDRDASGSGVDPDISHANAVIQARRIARVRGIPLVRVLAL